jgi:hypothetical protein
MRWDLVRVAESDGIVLLPEWETSSGATHERYIAEVCNRDVWLGTPDGAGGWIVELDTEQVRIPKGALEPLAPAPAVIVGLSGWAQAGKDSTGNLMVAHHGFERIAFADALRSMLYTLNPLTGAGRVRDVVDGWGWEYAKSLPEVRALLQRLGTEAGRDVIGENVWVDAAMAKIEPGGRYVITDVRFPNEAEAIRQRGGEVWRIVRDAWQPANGHPSERALDGYDFDRVLLSYPFAALNERVAELVKVLDAPSG